MKIGYKYVLYYLTIPLVGKCLSFISIPIITNYISTSEYAIFGIIQGLTDLFMIFATMQINTGFMRIFIDLDENEKIKFIISTIVFVCISCFLCFIIFISILKILDINETNQIKMYIYLGLLSSCFANIFFPLYEKWRLENNPIPYISFTITSSIINFIILLTFLIYFKLGLYSLFLAPLIANMFIGGIILVIFLIRNYNKIKHMKNILNVPLIKQALILSIPQIPVTGLNSIVKYADRYIMSIFFPLNIVGQYSFAQNLSFNINILYQSFDKFFYPIYILNKKELKPNYFAKIFIFHLLVMILISSGIFAYIYIFITNPSYKQSIKFLSFFLINSYIFFPILILGYEFAYHKLFLQQSVIYIFTSIIYFLWIILSLFYLKIYSFLIGKILNSIFIILFYYFYLNKSKRDCPLNLYTILQYSLIFLVSLFIIYYIIH